MLNSMQMYMKEILNGLSLPNQSQTLTAYVAPPVPGVLTGPTVYIWGAEWDDKRQSFPRIGNAVMPSPSNAVSGFRVINWSMYLYVYQQLLSNDPNADQSFPLVVDAIVNLLHTTPCPTYATDPTTGVQTEILAIGEHIHAQLAPVQDVGNQGFVLYDAMIVCDVREKVNA